MISTTHPVLLPALALLLAGPWNVPAAEASATFDRSHAAYTALLQRHVSNGMVDYAALKRDAVLGTYLASLSEVSREELEAWPESDRIAFWIDAYNAFTLQLILEHYPVKSIRSIGFLPGSAFRQEFIRLRAAGSAPISLDFIEHETLRKRFREPRVHFALVCASASCPSLRGEAYRGADLDRQLEEATRAFLADQRKNRFDAATRTLHLSAIFKWFGEDFERAAGSVPAFVSQHALAEFGAVLSSGPVAVEYEPYDWSLNGR